MFKLSFFIALFLAIIDVSITSGSQWLILPNLPISPLLIIDSTMILWLLIHLIVVWKQSDKRQSVISTRYCSILNLIIIAVYGLKAGLFLQNYPLALLERDLLAWFGLGLIFKYYLTISPKLTIHNNPLKPSRILMTLAMLLLSSQIIIGYWVQIHQAAFVCSEFPLCDLTKLHVYDFQNSLNLFASALSFEAKLALHSIHRLLGLVNFVVLTLVIFQATADHYPKIIRRLGLILSVLLLITLASGIFVIRWEFLIIFRVIHHLLSGSLLLPLIAIQFYSRYSLDSTVSIDKVIPDIIQPVNDSLTLRLKSQLAKTRHGLGAAFAHIPFGHQQISDDLLEEIEANLLLADIGIEATTEIIDKLTEGLDKHRLNDGEALWGELKQDLCEMLLPCSQSLHIPKQEKPFVILVVGVNGVGKTTTIGKLAKKLQNQGLKVMLAAGDTFRAAAVEQLQIWGERNQIPVVAQQSGADSASVIFDALQSATAKKIDVLIADTAGRLHTKSNLMEELKKIKRIINRLDPDAPHEVLLILDAGTGQNALSQAKLFNETVALTGLVLTKLDGTAKGGIIFALAKQLQIPIRYIGVGESIDDLQEFDAQRFVHALFTND
ncbi:MAG: hypothetical protein RL637_722 [Pseudomonadota bacterium]